MDPYQTLGLAPGCTRDQVKEAFRARVWHAHPDRGGAEQPFIELCAAYKQLLGELGRGPAPGSFARPTASRRPDPAAPESGAARPMGGSKRADRTSRPPLTGWVPDLVLDEDGRSLGPSRPPDPDWEPELIVLDQPPVPEVETPAKGHADDGYASWVRRLSANSGGRSPFWQSKLGQALGVTILLAVLAANLWLCWALWDLESREKRHPDEPSSSQPK
jgi:curved DNA-binding protein CbpA